METEIFFRGLVPVLLIAFAAHRGYYVKTHSIPKDATLKKREEGLASKVAGLLGIIGFLSIVVYCINPAWIGFAAIQLPILLRWAGMVMAILGFALLILWTGKKGVWVWGSAAEARYTSKDEVNLTDLKRWLKKSREIQWDYKNVVKRKGVLERLK